MYTSKLNEYIYNIYVCIHICEPLYNDNKNKTLPLQNISDFKYALNKKKKKTLQYTNIWLAIDNSTNLNIFFFVSIFMYDIWKNIPKLLKPE